jgi:FkbH-like protein
MSALPEVADTLAAAVVAKAGKARKVLVLDLDNTVWGGVVGDIGKDGLELGPETAEGEAFTAFQSYARALGQRGVILALCSKNNEALAMSAFREHPAMVLKEKDIAAFVINFEEKATNIRRIAETLNVGLESIVFADDNPIERAWVRKQLPEVAVVELPENPACYAAAVEAEKLFPTIALTTEDLARNQSYRAIAVTRAASEQALDMDQFLRDLDPVALLEPVSDGSIDRIVQLIGKTNQFKLNSSIFDAAEIRQRAAYTIALRLRDRLQDYGIVAVAVTSPDGDSLRILNWVMSCRVFSRRLEHAMVDVLTRLARRACGSSIVLDFQLSAKNGLVPGVLKQLGFSETSPGRYAVALDHPTQPHFMKIEHLEVVV